MRSAAPSAPTRWNFSSRVVNAFASNYDELHDIFENIIALPTMDDETIRLADGLRRKMEEFEICIH